MEAQSRQQVTIGITGGIGSGKSYVAHLMQEHLGIPVYDCDREAKRLTSTDREIRQKLLSLLGPEVFLGDSLNKQLLAEYLFGDAEHASLVGAIIHPAVLKDFSHWAARQQPQVVALESAILFESGFDAYVDKVLFVDAPIEVRLQRAMRRDRATVHQVQQRMDMQQPELYRSRADYIICNDNADDTRLLEQLRHFIHNIASHSDE